MIRNLTYKIFALILVIAMLPTMFGLSLVRHYCSGCGEEEKEIAFLLISHQHDDLECFCKHSAEKKECIDEAETCECNSISCETHRHFCFIDYKKPEINCINQQYNEKLPVPTKLDVFKGVIPEFASIFANNYNKDKFERFLYPPPLQDSDINIFNCIFRL